MKSLISFVQALVIVFGAPLLRGFVSKMKARLQGRQGASVWRPFADLGKLFLPLQVFFLVSYVISCIAT